MPMVMPPVGGANPQNIQALAAAGDPRAIAILQGQGGPPGGPPQGMPPQGAPSMTQADFSGYGKPVNADAEARRAAMLIQMLRQRGG